MKKTILSATLFISLLAVFSSCSEDVITETDDQEQQEDLDMTPHESQQELVEEEQVSPLGNFSELVGEWTVDEATAGVKMVITFGEDGSLSQVMGPVNGLGTWKIVDEKHIIIATQNTKGQTWEVTDITDSGVNICWNPESAKPKVIPMKRVQ